MSSPETNILAEKLITWLAQSGCSNIPSSSSLVEYLESTMLEEAPNVPVLLKADTSKRLRELAGIPHKGNYT